MDIKSLGPRLVEYRKKHNFTQKDIANKLNVSSQLVSKWEKSQTVPSVEYLVELSELFGVSLDELVLNRVHKAKVTKEKKKFKFTKPWLYSIIAGCSAIFLTGIILLSIYVFAPAANKERYLEAVGESMHKFLDTRSYFNISLQGKVDGSVVEEQYFQCNIDESGVDYYVYGDEYYINEKIVDDIKYTLFYKTEYDIGYTSVKEIFENKVSAYMDVVSDEAKDFDIKDVKYIRKVKNGFIIKIDADVLREQIPEDEKDIIKYDGDLEGFITIKNGVFKKFEVSIIMRNVVKEENFLIESSIEFIDEKPEILPDDVPWLHSEFYSSQELIDDVYKDIDIKELVADEIVLERVLETVKGGKIIKFINGNIWYTYYLSGLSKYYISAFNVKTFETVFEKEIYNDDWFLYENQFIHYNSTNIESIYLDDIEVKNTSVGAGLTTGYQIEDNYLVIKSNASAKDKCFYVVYDMDQNKIIGQTKTVADEQGGFSSNCLLKNKVIYFVSNNYNYLDNDYDSIYAYDILKKEETFVTNLYDFSGLEYIGSNGSIYYSYNYTIRKLGSAFEYSYGKIEEKDDLLYITYSDNIYIYQGESLLRVEKVKKEEPEEPTIYEDKKLILVDENDDIYIGGKGVVYHGSYEDYSVINSMYLNLGDVARRGDPTIIDCVGEYIVVSLGTVNSHRVIGLYKKTELARVYKTYDVGVEGEFYKKYKLSDKISLLMLGDKVYVVDTTAV